MGPLDLCLWSYGGPRGGAFSYERGTPEIVSFSLPSCLRGSLLVKQQDAATRASYPPLSHYCSTHSNKTLTRLHGTVSDRDWILFDLYWKLVALPRISGADVPRTGVPRS